MLQASILRNGMALVSTKLVFFLGVSRAGAAIAPGGVGAGIRGGASSSPADDRSTPTVVDTPPPLRTPLECRWDDDPMTGCLSAHWVDRSADVSTAAAAGRIVDTDQ
jgi:hypothetical protein